MKVLVTGGTGFVGSHVVRAIQDAGHDVRALVRKGSVPGAERAEGDMTDSESLRRAAQGVDAVVHLVAIRQGKEEQFQRVMVDGTRDLLAAAREAGVGRFVHMSALGTSEETQDLVPYYRAKWLQEGLVRESGLEHVIFRPSFVFGRDGGILPTFRTLAKVAPVTPIVGSGKQRIQPIWVDDVARYFAQALDKPEAANRTFELGGPDVVTWNELWTRLKRALGVRRPSMHVPMAFMRVNALVTERLPGDIPLTRDLLKMLEHGDNVVTNTDAVETFGAPARPAGRAAPPRRLSRSPLARGGRGSDRASRARLRCATPGRTFARLGRRAGRLDRRDSSSLPDRADDATPSVTSNPEYERGRRAARPRRSRPTRTASSPT